MPSGLSIVLIDARGGGRLSAYYAGPKNSAGCEYLEITPAGAIVQGQLSSEAGTHPPSVELGQLAVISNWVLQSAGGEDWQAVFGRAGPGIDRVILDVADLGLVTATLRDGWFSAWWPVGQERRPKKAFAISGYDVLGRKVADFCGLETSLRDTVLCPSMWPTPD